MNLYFEIGEVLKTNEGDLVACGEKYRPDGNSAIFLRLYDEEGGKQ